MTLYIPLKDNIQRMIDTQAAHITRLNKEVKRLGEENSRLLHENRQLRPAHDYYMLIQKHAIADDTIMSAWQSFIATMSLVFEEEVPDLTAAPKRNR